MFYVYILENPAGKFYIGQTDDIKRRLTEHNSPEAGSKKFTHKNGPWKLVYSESFESRSKAMLREKQIKSMKSSRWIRENLLSNR